MGQRCVVQLLAVTRVRCARVVVVGGCVCARRRGWYHCGGSHSRCRRLEVMVGGGTVEV